MHLIRPTLIAVCCCALILCAVRLSVCQENDSIERSGSQLRMELQDIARKRQDPENTQEETEALRVKFYEVFNEIKASK